VREKRSDLFFFFFLYVRIEKFVRTRDSTMSI